MRGIVVPVIVLNAGLEDSWGQENPCARTAFKGLSHQGRSGAPSVRADTCRKGSCAKAGFGPLVHTLNLRALGLVASWGPSRG